MTVAQATPLTKQASIEDARGELSKFFAIAEIAEKAPEMFSKFIDAEWHRMMESTNDYTRFCMDSVGHLVGHKDGPGYGVVSWVDLYHERFGTLPAAWFAGAQGIVDMAGYESYLDSRGTTADPPGLFKAWDCTPTTGDPDFLKTSPDPILPPVPDEAAPAQ